MPMLPQLAHRPCRGPRSRPITGAALSLTFSAGNQCIVVIKCCPFLPRTGVSCGTDQDDIPWPGWPRRRTHGSLYGGGPRGAVLRHRPPDGGWRRRRPKLLGGAAAFDGQRVDARNAQRGGTGGSGSGEPGGARSGGAWYGGLWHVRRRAARQRGRVRRRICGAGGPACSGHGSAARVRQQWGGRAWRCCKRGVCAIAAVGERGVSGARRGARCGDTGGGGAATRPGAGVGAGADGGDRGGGGGWGRSGVPWGNRRGISRAAPAAPAAAVASGKAAYAEGRVVDCSADTRCHAVPLTPSWQSAARGYLTHDIRHTAMIPCGVCVRGNPTWVRAAHASSGTCALPPHRALPCSSCLMPSRPRRCLKPCPRHDPPAAVLPSFRRVRPATPLRTTQGRGTPASLGPPPHLYRVPVEGPLARRAPTMGGHPRSTAPSSSHIHNSSSCRCSPPSD